MYKRTITERLIKRITEPRLFIQIMTGPRQTGKTTTVLQTLEECGIKNHYVSADEQNLARAEWLRNEWETARSLAKDGEAILAVDEIQKISDWPSIVKMLWDEDTRNRVPLKVILTGSPTLFSRTEESLMGRFEVLHSPHWNYNECRQAFGYTLDDFLLFGGYPGAQPLKNDEKRWAQYMSSSIIEPVISQDILMLEDIRKPALLRSLFLHGSGYSAQEISLTKLLGQLQNAGNTVTLAHYLELLDEVNLLTGLQNYSGELIRIRKSTPRFMVYDTSLMTYAEGAGRKRLLENKSYRGWLVETAVGASLLARSKEEDFKIFWWRERGNEVDFVLQKRNKLTAIEIKSGRVKNAGGGIVFKNKYPEAFSMVVGGANFGLENFLMGRFSLFL
ncbi:MAG: DUF4143 domain-containing protein [Defluviitaleaceae bacterium]|nr:DUF4143 domain-containing protein [Defluviitaleaceae bacterium]